MKKDEWAKRQEVYDAAVAVVEAHLKDRPDDLEHALHELAVKMGRVKKGRGNDGR